MRNKQLQIALKIVVLCTLFFLVQCKKKDIPLINTETSIASEKLSTDSVSIAILLNKNDTLKNNITEVLQFYNNRNYKMAWFTPNGLSLNAITFYNQLQNYSYDFADDSLENKQLNEFFSNQNQSKLSYNTRVKLEVL